MTPSQALGPSTRRMGPGRKEVRTARWSSALSVLDAGPGGVAEPGSGAEHREDGPGRKEVRTASWSSALSVLLWRHVFTTSMHAWTSKRTC